MTGLVRYAVDEHAVAFVTLDSPRTRNAPSDDLRDLSLPEALSALRSQLALAFTTEDIVEGVAAFREKRDPVWKVR
jgi:enoyl-CoA hydratase/carnithine racemase